MLRASLFVFLFAFSMCVGSLPAFAQFNFEEPILLDSDERRYIVPNIFMVHDPQGIMSAQSVATRFESGTQFSDGSARRVLKLTADSDVWWLAFKVDNKADVQDWVLDFGRLFEGRLGRLHNVMIMNMTTQEMVLDTLSLRTSGQALPSYRYGVPLTIARGQDQVFVMRVQSEGRLPAYFAPSLMPEFIYEAHYAQSSLFLKAWIAVLILCAGGFAALAAMMWSVRPVWTAVFLLSAVLLGASLDGMVLVFSSSAMIGVSLAVMFMVVASIFVAEWFMDVTDSPGMNTFIPAFAVAGVCFLGALFYALPLDGFAGLQQNAIVSVVAISLLYVCTRAGVAVYHNTSLPYYYAAGAWLCYGLGILFFWLGFAVFGQDASYISLFYYLAFIPCAVLLFMAELEIAQDVQKGTITSIERKSQALIQQAALEQEQAVADQDRLLRVIEREREIMADLREREAQQTQDMRRARDEADNANAAKSAFLAVISHEIRTPMNGIMGILKLMQSTSLSKEQSDYILTMMKTGDTMSALLNDILDFEKIETGKMELESISIDLHAMARGIMTLMAGYVGTKDVELLTEIGEDVPRYILCDPTRLRQVLMNLVSNAIKFTDTGSVTIKLDAVKLNAEDIPGEAKHDYEITFRVIDTGIGISEEAQASLFEPFKQVDSSIARRYGGSGLGLAITMRLIEIMGSAINLESATGEGSQFYFSLLVDEGYGDEYADSLAEDQIGSGDVSGLHVLVVEDNEINRKVLQNLLEKDQHRVSAAQSGEQALEILNRDDEYFDIVFIDINLDGMSGLDVARALRAMDDPYLSSVPMVAITGNLRPEDIAEIEASGINDVVGKPIDFNKIATLLKEVQDKNIVTNTYEHHAPDVLAKDALPTLEDDTLLSDYPMFDLEIILGLYDSLGAETMQELIDGCFDKADEIIEALAAADKRDDADFIRARLHELKGMAHNFGLKALGDVAGEGEVSAKADTLVEALAAVDSLPAARDEAKAAFAQWLEGQADG